MTVMTEICEGIATITLNRPEFLNALDEATRLLLADALTKADRSPEVRAIILTGAGRGFCVGQDLSQTGELEDCHDCVARTYNPLVAKLAHLDTPVIAAVNGPAVGAGMGFALGCDLIYMADTSFYSCAFGKVGLVPDSGATYYLSRALGHQRAFEIAISGRRILPDEAVALGLANRAVPANDLMTCAREAALMIANTSAKAAELTKALLRAAGETTLSDAAAREALAQGVAGRQKDHLDLRAAFLAKSK